jgi:hypothetical protein
MAHVEANSKDKLKIIPKRGISKIKNKIRNNRFNMILPERCILIGDYDSSLRDTPAKLLTFTTQPPPEVTRIGRCQKSGFFENA